MSTSTANNQFPPFPEDIIQGLAREFVELYAPIREVLPQALWLSFCTYLGAVVSPHVKLAAENSEPRLFGAIVGRSARTRKSTANNAARDLFRQAFPGNNPLRIVEGFGSSEGLLAMLKAPQKGTSTILHLDEINVIAHKTAQENTLGISAFHKLFDGHDCDHYLAAKDYTVRGAHLSVIGACTTDDFTTVWTAKQEDAGFLSRLLLVGADDPVLKKSIPKQPDAKKLDNLVKSVQGLFEEVKECPAVFELNAEAEQLWTNYHTSSIGPENVWNRIDTYGFRLMALQALLEGDETVRKATVQRIIDFLNYEVAVRTLLEPNIGENQAAVMERAIIRALRDAGWVKHRELQRRTNYNRYGVKMFNNATASLEQDGQIEIERGKNGRPVAYRLIETEDRGCHQECHQAHDDSFLDDSAHKPNELHLTSNVVSSRIPLL